MKGESHCLPPNPDSSLAVDDCRSSVYDANANIYLGASRMCDCACKCVLSLLAAVRSEPRGRPVVLHKRLDNPTPVSFGAVVSCHQRLPRARPSRLRRHAISMVAVDNKVYFSTSRSHPYLELPRYSALRSIASCRSLTRPTRCDGSFLQAVFDCHDSMNSPAACKFEEHSIVKAIGLQRFGGVRFP